MAARTPTPVPHRRFIIGVFVVAIAIGLVVMYLGINHYIGGPIVGSP